MEINCVCRAFHPAGAQQIFNNVLHYALLCRLFSEELSPRTITFWCKAASTQNSWFCLPSLASMQTIGDSTHAQSCPTLGEPMDCHPPGASVRGIFQARILEWVAMPSSRGSSQPGDRTHVSCISFTAGGFFTHCTMWDSMCECTTRASVALA